MGDQIERKLDTMNQEPDFHQMQLLFKNESIQVKQEIQSVSDAAMWKKISSDCLTNKAITNIKL